MNFNYDAMMKIGRYHTSKACRYLRKNGLIKKKKKNEYQYKS